MNGSVDSGPGICHCATQNVSFGVWRAWVVWFCWVFWGEVIVGGFLCMCGTRVLCGFWLVGWFIGRGVVYGVEESRCTGFLWGGLTQKSGIRNCAVR